MLVALGARLAIAVDVEVGGPEHGVRQAADRDVRRLAGVARERSADRLAGGEVDQAILTPPLRRFLERCHEVADRGAYAEGLALMNLVLAYGLHTAVFALGVRVPAYELEAPVVKVVEPKSAGEA